MIPTEIAVIRSFAGKSAMIYIAGIAISPPETETMTGIYLSFIKSAVLQKYPIT